MKKIIIVLIFILVLFSFNNNENDHLRVRVKANSDSYIDQHIKKEIVEIVVKEIDANDTKKMVEKKVPILKEKIEQYLKGKYKISVSIKNEYYPEKSLNGKIIESGYYESLVIEIGKAEGKNWWTLLYPEYFNITYDEIESGEIETKFYFYEKYKEKFK